MFPSSSMAAKSLTESVFTQADDWDKLRRPFNDVSRGCSSDDIVDCAAMAAITEWTD